MCSRWRTRVLALPLALVVIVSGGVVATADVNGSDGEDYLGVALDEISRHLLINGGRDGERERSSSGGSRPKIYTDERPWESSSEYGCGTLYDISGRGVDGRIGGRNAACEMSQALCEVRELNGGESRGVTEIVRVNTVENDESLLGFGCAAAGDAANALGVEGEPVVITVTREDFAKMPVEPLVPHAGPPNGWVPVNMVNVLYVEPEAQTLDVELLDTPVQVRATPISYHWDLGDGNTITTSKPGKPYPSEEVASEYTYEGWYDITLTTTFRGEFSVDGGEWQPIEGTIEVASDPVGIFAKSFESRLVDGDVPVDEEEDPWVPERSPETEGPQDPEARHREI